MTSRLPRAATVPAPATLPPSDLPGLDPAFSRLIDVHESDGVIGGAQDGAPRTWHVLDNGPRLAQLGVTPVGTILCVHGNPTWSYLWRSLVSQATDAALDGKPAWRVIAVDQLDMGFSERTGVARPLARRVRDLDDFTTAIGLDGPVVTLGHDWGGVVSMGWAVNHPDLLSGVMMLNTAIHQPESSPIPAPLRLALGPGILGRATVATPAFLETTLALAHPPLASDVKNAYRAPYRTAERRGGIGGFVADIPVDAAHESTPELDRIASELTRLTVPTLMLWGPRDPIFGDRYLDDLVDRMPHADVHRFEGAGHLIAEDVDYASSVLTWLADQAGLESLEALASLESFDAAAEHPEVGVAPGLLLGDAAPARNRLWHYLDELRDSDETALIEMVPAQGAGPRVVSWKLLSKRVNQIAAGLNRIGVKKGDRVSLLIQPGADLTAVLYACLRLGAIVVIADAGLGLRGLTRAVRGAWPDHVIGQLPGLVAARALGWPGQKISTVRYPASTGAALGLSHALADIVELGVDQALPEEPAATDVAAVLFTSGSTGPAKGVVYTHDQLSAIVEALSGQYGVGVGTGLVAGFAPFALLGPALGARSVTPDMNVTSPKTLTASAVAAAVAAVEATVVFLSPAAVANVVATSAALTDLDRSALAGVQDFLSAGAPVSEPLLTAIAALMPNASAHTPYGMTEGLLMTDITLEGIREAALAVDADGPGGVCVGLPTATTRVRISALNASAEATGELSTEPGITGEIVVSAPHLKDHYDRLWRTDRASRIGAIAGERWHRTGDVGHFDAAGRLWVEGRLPHVIAAPTGVVTPVGLELSFEKIPTVSRAAAVGIGPAGTQAIVAIIETQPPARRVSLASPELAASVRASVSQPVAAVIVLPHLPTDIRHNSKIDRTKLSLWAARILGGGRMVRP
ncbi:alpha/beta fold hydrolase [Glaciihabitans sp. dw_435]|uniref:alpha/beta fold hydrolase n=1 Tax=Glaciihabitans sp. dw_435 TaxID=2720081 RepID=UPI0027DC4643|nr:alpha/beta fold hydrolase [Glaciihabitans sp. dw_435]